MIYLERGQGYAIDNHRWMHGRRAYRGARVLLRVAVEPRRETVTIQLYVDLEGDLAGLCGVGV
jgi:hypothetical protein